MVDRPLACWLMRRPDVVRVTAGSSARLTGSAVAETCSAGLLEIGIWASSRQSTHFIADLPVDQSPSLRTAGVGEAARVRGYQRCQRLGQRDELSTLGFTEPPGRPWSARLLTSHRAW